MKLIFASDSFKGTLSSEQTMELLAKASHEVFGPCETLGILVADGGETFGGAAQASFTVMCDVTNPLCGENGATFTFGAQKGGTPEILERLEKGMRNYRDVIIREFGVNPDTWKGTGAAGGLGTALLVFFNAKMKSGIDVVLDLIRFNNTLNEADLVVTGEGRTDWQSCFGKVMQGVGDRAKANGVPVVALCGGLGPGYEDIYHHGVDSIMTTVDGPMPLQKALDEAEDLYYKGAVRLFRMIRTGMQMQKKESIT